MGPCARRRASGARRRARAASPTPASRATRRERVSPARSSPAYPLASCRSRRKGAHLRDRRRQSETWRPVLPADISRRVAGGLIQNLQRDLDVVVADARAWVWRLDDVLAIGSFGSTRLLVRVAGLMRVTRLESPGEGQARWCCPTRHPTLSRKGRTSLPGEGVKEADATEPERSLP